MGMITDNERCTKKNTCQTHGRSVILFITLSVYVNPLSMFGMYSNLMKKVMAQYLLLRNLCSKCV